MKTKVGELIKKGREEKNLSMRQLAELAKVSHSDISRIESGEREVPNPKILRKISQHIGINYNDLMYAAGLGFQVTDLNPFLKSYYKNLKGEEIVEALANTSGSIRTWRKLISSFKEKLKDENLTPQEREIMQQTIEDTEYQIKTAEEIEKLLLNSNVDDFREREKDKNEEDDR
ncbi:MAG: helix-turn-helix domain-containing protein [Bacilli bacterium]|nr:helix-turn-helix domain-containing protein [Bacilli bacterium]